VEKCFVIPWVTTLLSLITGLGLLTACWALLQVRKLIGDIHRLISEHEERQETLFDWKI